MRMLERLDQAPRQRTTAVLSYVPSISIQIEATKSAQALYKTNMHSHDQKERIAERCSSQIT